MKSVDQTMKQNCRFVLYYNKIRLYYFPRFPVSSPLKEGASQFQCMPNSPRSSEGKKKNQRDMDDLTQELKV